MNQTEQQQNNEKTYFFEVNNSRAYFHYDEAAQVLTHDGLLDHTDSLNNQIDSLSYEYKKRLDELTRHSDTIEIRHTVFTLKPKQI